MIQADKRRQLHHYIHQKEQEIYRKFVEFRSDYEHTGKTSSLLAQSECQGAVTVYQDLLSLYEMRTMIPEHSEQQPSPVSDSAQNNTSFPKNLHGFQTLREYCDQKHQDAQRRIIQCQQRYTATGNEKYLFLQKKYTGEVLAYGTVIQFLNTLTSPDEEPSSQLSLLTDLPRPDVVKGPIIKSPKKTPSFVHILALEASSVMRKMLQMLLTSEGFTVTTASDGVIGLDMARKILPDLILMDSNIAWRNEEQLLFLLRRDKRLRRIPVILLTSNARRLDGRLKRQLGVMSSIQKPFQPEELLNIIQDILER